MDFTSTGSVTRTNTPVYFSGNLDGQGKAFVTSDVVGAWTWTGGTLKNGVYDPMSAGALKMDPTAPNGGYGQFRKATLVADLNVKSGFYVNVYEGLTLQAASGKPAPKILLNGTSTGGRACTSTTRTSAAPVRSCSTPWATSSRGTCSTATPGRSAAASSYTARAARSAVG
jgi:hypothetical protein